MRFLAYRSVVLAALCAQCWLPSASFAQSADDQFAALVDEIWEFTVSEEPQFATSTGDHRFNDRLQKVSLADSERRDQIQREFLGRVESLDCSQLSPTERINYDILRRQLADRLAEFDFQSHLVPITQRVGFHIEFPELPKNMPLNTTVDLRQLRGPSCERSATIQMGTSRSCVQESLPVRRCLPLCWRIGEKAIDAQIVERPEQSLLYEPCKDFPSTLASSEHERLKSEISSAIAETVVPAYRRFRQFMSDEYVPDARGSIGASALPRGRDFYRHRVRRFTTLDITPEEVHQIGLAEVKRIRGEMDEIIRRVEFDGDFAAFTKFLREDPQFYAQTEEELLRAVAMALKGMDGQLPTLFGKLPRMSYGLQPVPEYIAPRHDLGVLPTSQRRWHPRRVLFHEHVQSQESSVVYRRGVCRSTRRCRGTICSWRCNKKLSRCPISAASVVSRRSSKGGRSIPSDLGWRQAFMKILTAISDG